MVVCGIIAEYNPFHNGHMYQIRRIREKLNPDYIVVALGGNFTERGEISIFNKFDKAKLALEMGVDLVVEIPAIFSCSSAERFASAGVTVLENLKVVTHICFGAETSNLDMLSEVAKVLTCEPKQYKKLLLDNLKTGISYPEARSKALYTYFDNKKDITNIMSEANNILAIEYLKELNRLKSKMKPYLIKRNGPGFHSSDIKDNISSATNIRRLISTGNDVSNFVPSCSLCMIEKYKNKLSKRHNTGAPIIMSSSLFDNILLYKLKTINPTDLKKIADVREGIDNTLLNLTEEASIKNIITKAKSKRFTYTSISRILNYILLDIKNDDLKSAYKYNNYVRILGFRKNSTSLLTCISDAISNHNKKSFKKIYLISNINKFIKENRKTKNKNIIGILSELEKEIRYNNIYHLMLDNITNSDNKEKMIVIE